MWYLRHTSTKTSEKTEGAIKNWESRDTGKTWAHKTQDEDKQSNKNITQKAKKMSNIIPIYQTIKTDYYM
jgi:photosystem II stability/assembly factor-like uncharacterized protein